MVGSLRSWGEILRTQNLAANGEMDGVSRWLLITRASVIPITFFAGALGVLLAARAEDPHWLYEVVAMLGVVAGHAASNMIVDYADLETGVDHDTSARVRFAPHPVRAGLISRKGLLLAIAGVNLLDLGILLFLTEARGWPVAAFALSGLFIAVFYVTPPIQLKHRGFGEVGVLLLWGPLMTGGTYYVTSGQLAPWVLVASLPYGMLVTAVLLGRHIDQLDSDAAHGLRTLPVVLGRERALFLTQQILVSAFVLLLCLVLLGTYSVWMLLCLLALPALWRTLRTFNCPRPAAAPADHPAWPLWYVASAFRLARWTGALMVLGCLVDTLVPLRLG